MVTLIIITQHIYAAGFESAEKKATPPSAASYTTPTDIFEMLSSAQQATMETAMASTMDDISITMSLPAVQTFANKLNQLIDTVVTRERETLLKQIEQLRKQLNVERVEKMRAHEMLVTLTQQHISTAVPSSSSSGGPT